MIIRPDISYGSLPYLHLQAPAVESIEPGPLRGI